MDNCNSKAAGNKRQRQNNKVGIDGDVVSSQTQKYRKLQLQQSNVAPDTPSTQQPITPNSGYTDSTTLPSMPAPYSNLVKHPSTGAVGLAHPHNLAGYMNPLAHQTPGYAIGMATLPGFPPPYLQPPTSTTTTTQCGPNTTNLSSNPASNPAVLTQPPLFHPFLPNPYSSTHYPTHPLASNMPLAFPPNATATPSTATNLVGSQPPSASNSHISSSGTNTNGFPDPSSIPISGSYPATSTPAPGCVYGTPMMGQYMMPGLGFPVIGPGPGLRYMPGQANPLLPHAYPHAFHLQSAYSLPSLPTSGAPSQAPSIPRVSSSETQAGPSNASDATLGKPPAQPATSNGTMLQQNQNPLLQHSIAHQTIAAQQQAALLQAHIMASTLHLQHQNQLQTIAYHQHQQQLAAIATARAEMARTDVQSTRTDAGATAAASADTVPAPLMVPTPSPTLPGTKILDQVAEAKDGGGVDGQVQSAFGDTDDLSFELFKQSEDSMDLLVFGGHGCSSFDNRKGEGNEFN